MTTLGIGIGFHRMLTHKGFEARGPVRAFFLALGSMALEGPAIAWAATHLKHHAKSDKDGDPHSPLEGFWHAVGWISVPTPLPPPCCVPDTTYRRTLSGIG